MAETVTWDGLRELAEFRAEKGCAITLYVDLDPSIVPTAGDADAKGGRVSLVDPAGAQVAGVSNAPGKHAGVLRRAGAKLRLSHPPLP